MDAVIALVLVVGGLGCWLLATSLPGLRGRGLRARVDPFLHGLRGKPSRLLIPGSVVRWSWAGSLLARWGLVGSATLRARLEAAGRDPDEVRFRLEQGIWAGVVAGAVIVVVLVTAAAGVVAASPSMALVATLGGFTAALGRDWYLTREIERRRATLRDQLPTAMDHMMLILLAGGSIATAFARVAHEAPPVVAEEFARVDADIRGGSTVVDALGSFRARVPDASIAAFVDAMCTAVERGTSVTETLKGQADDVREARRRYLIELGGRREVLMLVPVVFLIMPVLVLFALYPGLVSLDLLVP